MLLLRQSLFPSLSLEAKKIFMNQAVNGFDFELFSFFILGILSLICGGVLATRKVPVSAAMMLICIFICMAGMYGLLDAHFAAVSQILVYAGAIMVVFLFVIMLLNIPTDEIKFGKLSVFEIILTAFSLVAAIALGSGVFKSNLSSFFNIPENLESNVPLVFSEAENVKNVAVTMFTQYLWPFEIVSLVILVATIGSVVISKKRSSNAGAA
jgi:NADH-quinone oxidoreductase subunit J